MRASESSGESADVWPRYRDAAGRARYRAAYERALGAWPVPHQRLEITTRFGVTHVVASGPAAAPPLVLLHSLAASALVWRPNAEALSQRHRLYAVDVIGQSGVSVATRRLRSRRDFADWFADLLDGLGVARTSIVGCSFGAFLALSQAALTPERVERVVLIGPPGSFARLSRRFVLLLLSSALRRRVRRWFGDARPPDIARMLGPGAVLSAQDAAWEQLMQVTFSEQARLCLIPTSVLDSAELQAIRAPALLLIGEHERLYDARAMLALAQRRMPGLQGAVVPGAHHIAALAQPADVNARILAFLQGAATGQGAVGQGAAAQGDTVQCEGPRAEHAERA